jgi:hypothetical protein
VFLQELLFAKALAPTAVLNAPDSPKLKAASTMPTLLLPDVLPDRANLPMATLQSPVVLF